MNHLGTQYIETKRLVLRRFELPDAQAMLDNWASDDEVTKYLTWPTHSDVSVTEQVLQDWIPQYLNSNYYNWAVVLKENGTRPIGNISVVRWDETGEIPEMGYCIGKRWWRQGIMSEALGAVIDFLFDQVGVRRIEARHDTNNPHSGGVMRRCGMRLVETREKADQNNQGICDVSCYTIEAGER